jgi:hypothetical protein
MNENLKTQLSLPIPFFILAVGAFVLSGCGSDFQSPFVPAPNINSGYSHTCVTPTPSPSPTPAPSPTPTQDHSHSFPCNIFPHLPFCNRSADILDSTPPVCGDPKAIYNTNYCQVDANGNTSADVVQVTQADHVHVLGGGCINRSIRDTWGAILDHPAMKPDDVDDYNASYHPEMVDPTQGQVFAFLIVNTVHALGGLVNPSWTVTWYHSIKLGTFEQPLQIIIDYQKTDGTSHINYQKGGWELDEVTPTVTSFTIDQQISADRYDIDKGNSDFHSIISKIRTVAPAEDLLNKPCPVNLPVNSRR